MDYDLTRLGTREFEHLCQSLFAKLLGSRVTVFGDGPDGGREATYEGQSRWTIGADREVWNGYQVLQAKFRARLFGTSDDQEWFLGEVANELKRWLKPDSKRQKKGRLPDYLILATNVTLSAAEGGGIDRIAELMNFYAPQLNLKGWHVWHYAQICAYLDDAPGIRQTYAGLLTSGDVFANLQQVLSGLVVDMGQALTDHAVKDLLADRWVRFGQAGSTVNDKHTIQQIAVDLESSIAEKPEEILETAAYIISHGDRVLRRSIVDEAEPRHFIVVGGPGQGKTTIGQIITQSYRVALLESTLGKYGSDVRQTVIATREKLDEQKIGRPSNLRWPIRIDLAEYGEEISGGQHTSLVRWISQQISRRGNVDVSAAQLNTWLANWPWLLVMDGLDEVASLHAREQLMQRISEFLSEVESGNADVLIVVTTRPQGYGEEFARADFTHLVLRRLTTRRAIAYAKQLADVRHAGDEDMRRQIIDRVTQASTEPLTARLMGTPLQVTIMSILLERRARPPQDRHGLFKAYYDTIYAREADKPGYLARLIDDYEDDIHALHEQVGIRLQVLAETAEDSDSSMPAEELGRLAVKRMKLQGHDDAESEKLARQVVQAATDRLVLLVPKGSSDVGFEVRSLQEYIAARAIASGVDDDVLRRMRIIAPVSHWRNTWLLAAGQIFSTREHLRSQLVAMLREIDSESLVNMVTPVGPLLALDLLDDDFAARVPAIRMQLLNHALEMFRHPVYNDFRTRAKASVLLEVANAQALRALIVRRLDESVTAPVDQRIAVYALAEQWSLSDNVLTPKAVSFMSKVSFTSDHRLAMKPLLPAKTKDDSGSVSEATLRRDPLGEKLESSIRDLELDEVPAGLVREFIATINENTVAYIGPDYEVGIPELVLHLDEDVVLKVLSNPIAAEAIALALLEVSVESWAVRLEVGTILRLVMQRKVVGPLMLRTFEGAEE